MSAPEPADGPGGRDGTFAGPPVDGSVAGPALTTGATLGGFLDEVVAAYPDREAIVFDDPLLDGDTVRWTYRDLGAHVERIAGGLIAEGVARGDVVAVLMGNRPEALAAILAAGSIGAVAAPVSTFSPVPELVHLLGLSRARVVLTQRRLLDRAFADDVRSVADRLPDLRSVVTLGDGSWDRFVEAGGGSAAAERAARRAEVGPDDAALIIFSSGTTSEPKGILHRHLAPTLQFRIQAELFGRHPGSRVYSALPLFWTAGLNTAVGSTLAAGGCWVAQEVFDPAGALALMERERVTEPYTLPHQTAALAEHPDWERTDLSSVTCAYGKGAYARHPRTRPDPHWVMPVGYGLSETCAFVAGYRSDDTREQVRIGSGRLLPGTRLRVVDPDTGAVLGVDEEGELAVGGATLMLGYLGRDPSTVFDGDGFLRTGDTGHVDADGIVHYTGRRTEMIKTGGANVSPAEIEVALRACPGVKLSKVVGIPDERLDQLVVACIVAAEGATLGADDVRSFLRERVAAYKVPKRVVFLDEAEVPMTAGGAKVRDDDLRELVLERLGAAGSGGTGTRTREQEHR